MPRHEWYADADANAFEVFLARQRSMSPAEKIRAVFEQNRLLHAVAEARERQLHPHADDREILLRVLAHRLDRETMLRVYGWYLDTASCGARTPACRIGNRADAPNRRSGNFTTVSR